MSSFVLDLRYGLRSLLKTPGFTLVAVLSLALGIGANTAVFSIMDALMLRSLPVHEPERLALFGSGRSMGIYGGIQGNVNLISEPQLKEFRANHRYFEDACGMFSMPWVFHPTVAGAAENEPLRARVVTGNYFSLLGVGAAAGRVFTQALDTPLNTHTEVVISDSYWRRRFGRSPGAVGTTMRLADRVYTIIGVAAPEFYGTNVGESPDAWFPLSMQAALPPFFDMHNENLEQSLYVIARLKPGVTLQQASAGVTLQLRQLVKSYVGSAPTQRDLAAISKMQLTLTPAGQGLSRLRRQYSEPLQIIMGVVGLVLLIACGNVANLLLARATARQREMAIRFAVGSGRFRVIRQLLTESLLLSVAGGILGVIVAMWGTQILLSLVVTGANNPVSLNVDPNLRVLGFTFAVSVFTGLLFGVAPALRASSVEPAAGMREGRSGTGTRSRMFLGRALVVSQVALSLLLLIGAGLFIRSFRNLASIDTGFERERVLLVSLDADASGYKKEDMAPLYRRIENRLGKVPGVESASFSMFGFSQGSTTLGVSVEGHPEVSAQDKTMDVNVTGPDYFRTMNVPLAAGRSLTEQDTAASKKVGVISEKAAREIFANESPLGKRVAFGDEQAPKDIEIVGVARDVKHRGLQDEPIWDIYIPYTQRPSFLGNLMVRAKSASPGMMQAVRKAIVDTDRNVPISEVTTMDALVSRSINTQHLIAQLSGFFGLLALALAAIGLYGILSYSVARRTPEIGVRMALGAAKGRVLWMILRETLLLVGAGMAIGAPAALLCSRLVRSMLYGLSGTDPVTTAAAIAVLLSIGAAAGWLPARRAASIDPMVALRYE